MAPEDAAKLRPLLEQCGAETFLAATCAEADRFLHSGTPIGAIFSTQRLLDGGIAELARMGNQFPKPVPVIVCLTQIDGGWIDLLEQGAFDVIVEPYRRERIQQVLEELTLYRTSAAGELAPSAAA